MPTVPQYNIPQVAAQGGHAPGLSADTGALAETTMGAASQALQLSQSAQRFGSQVNAMAVDAQQMANQVRVDAAMNDARQAAMQLTYDPQNGYLAQKGDAALNRQSGMPLSDEYAEQLKTHLDNIQSGLANDAQKRAFGIEAANLGTQFSQGVQTHMLQEYKSFALSTQQGTIKLAADQAERGWNNPDQIDSSIQSAQAAVWKQGQLLGKSANEVQAEMNEVTSAIHTKVIQSALENQNVTYAMNYLDKRKDAMTADDILRVQGSVNRQVDAYAAMGAVNNVLKQTQQAFQPNDFDRLTNIVLGIESRGHDTNPDGTPVTSNKGAKYAMQVMPETAKNPGFGIKPAQDDSAAEYNRVGREYLQALVRKYGDVGKAMAAYNAGPGAVDNAIDEAQGRGGSYLQYLPKETRNYVQNGLAAYGSGGGAPQMPTKSDFVNQALAQLGDNPRLEAINATRQQAEHAYDLQIQSRKEQGQQALQQAQQALIANGGNFAALDPSIKDALARHDPARYDDAVKFAKAVDPTREQATNAAAYTQAVTYPNELAKMPDAVFQQFLYTNFAPEDQKRIAKIRADALNGAATNSAESVNVKVMNQTLNNRLLAIGINPTPKHDDTAARSRIGTIQKFVMDSIYDAQQQKGGKLTPQEIEQTVDTLFAKNIDFQTTYLGGAFHSNSQQNMMSMQVSDIPADVRGQLKGMFQSRGVAKPTDDQMLRAYWKWKTNGKQ